MEKLALAISADPEQYSVKTSAASSRFIPGKNK